MEIINLGRVVGKDGADGTNGVDGANGKDGINGQDGFSPIAKVETTSTGATITITDKNGTTTTNIINGKDGVNGTDGKNGYTPVKGTDYWTEEDKEEINEYVGDIIPRKTSELTNDSGFLTEISEVDKAEITQMVIESLGGNPVFGYVDKDNNIIVSGNLPDGDYTVIYEMENGELINIGNLVLDNTIEYSIVNNLTNCTSTNNATTIVEGESYSATITANSGYELKSVSATMGGSAVSVSGGNINIAKVTGDIVITAVAEEKVEEINNLLRDAIDTDGSEYVGTHENGGDGYEYGYRISRSSGAQSPTDGVYCTGFMQADNNDIIYIKNASSYTTNISYNNIVFYTDSKSYITGQTMATGNTGITVTDNGYVVDINAILDNAGKTDTITFFRFSCGSITDETIVTVNQEIV